MGRQVKRRLIAVIDERTTVICLEACGQVVGAHEPFHTLNGDMWEPPFHVHCRSIVAPFVADASDALLRRARQELARRPAYQFRRMPPKPRRGVAARLRDLFRSLMYDERGSINVDARVLDVGARSVEFNGVTWTTDGKSWWLGDRVPAKIRPGDERLVSSKDFAARLDEALKGQSVPAPVVEKVTDAPRLVKNVWDDEETRALHWWIDNDNWELGRALRRGEMPDDDEMREVKEALDRAFSHAEYPESAPLYRGVTNLEDLGIKTDDLKPGTTFSDRSFASVTTEPQVAESYASGHELWDDLLEYYPDSRPAVLEIRGVKGRRIIDNSTGFRQTDSERLLDRGMKLRIVSVEDYRSVSAMKSPRPGTVKKIVVEVVDDRRVADPAGVVAGRRVSSWRRDDLDRVVMSDRLGAEKWAADIAEDYADVVRSVAPDGIRVEVVRARPSVLGKVSLEIEMTRGETLVGSIERTVDARRGEVVHELFTLSVQSGLRGRGFGRRLTEKSFELYRQMGVTRVKTFANVDVGGYAWARLGFTWDRGAMSRGDVERLLHDVFAGTQKVPGMDGKWSAETRAAYDRMLADLGAGRWPEPVEIAMMGWRPGVKVWPGKAGMLGTKWSGVRDV